MKITGTAICYGDNVDTDVIIPARYLNTSNPQELAAHCMEDLDPTFVKRVTSGDIMVGGHNFGCGSSREHAPIAIKASGIACVVAKSFARIFYRNAINTGLAIVEFEGEIAEGDKLEIDFEAGVLRNLSQNTHGTFPPFPEFLEKIISHGSLFPALEALI